jgi:hypothetical protein
MDEFAAGIGMGKWKIIGGELWFCFHNKFSRGFGRRFTRIFTD